MSRHWKKCPVAVFNIKMVYSAVIMLVNIMTVGDGREAVYSIEAVHSIYLLVLLLDLCCATTVWRQADWIVCGKFFRVWAVLRNRAQSVLPLKVHFGL